MNCRRDQDLTVLIDKLARVKRENRNEAQGKIKEMGNPIFSPNYASSRYNWLINQLDRVIKLGDKAVVMSQWPSNLELLHNT